jgi:hypothetical protein
MFGVGVGMLLHRQRLDAEIHRPAFVFSQPFRSDSQATEDAGANTRKETRSFIVSATFPCKLGGDGRALCRFDCCIRIDD